MTYHRTVQLACKHTGTASFELCRRTIDGALQHNASLPLGRMHEWITAGANSGRPEGFTLGMAAYGIAIEEALGKIQS